MPRIPLEQLRKAAGNTWPPSSMARWLMALAVAWLGASLSSCSPAGDLPRETSQQSVCGGSSELQEVELYDGRLGVSRAFVNRHRRAVGLLKWRNDLALRYLDGAGNVSGLGWCTGTLITDDLFLTAAHCLDGTNTGTLVVPHDKGGVALRPSELAREFIVEFRYELSAQPGGAPEMSGVKAEVLRLEEFRNKELDYAILRLSSNSGFYNGVTRVAPTDVEPGAHIAILQHPAATTMKVGAGSVADVRGAEISYDTIDTLGGSSGAGILDVATGKLVGIHTNGGCTKDGGGANYGISISALIDASPTLRALVDNSIDFYVGDWNGDTISDLAVFHDGCLYPDADHDDEPDVNLKQCPPDPTAEQYFVGRWQLGGSSRLGWRRGGCLYLDTQPETPLCYRPGDTRFDVLIADWDGDGKSDVGIQKGRCIDFDTNLDGSLDKTGYCLGSGLSEDEYLVGAWGSPPAERIAIRRGNSVLIDADRDGSPDQEQIYGSGGKEDQYLVGDWNGDGRPKLAVRRGPIALMSHGNPNGSAEEGRVFRDFWSVPASTQNDP